MTDTEIPKRRTARISLDRHLISQMLALPPGYEVRAVDTGNDPVHIVLIVESPDLPEVEHNATSPYAHPTVEVVTLDDGREFLRFTDLGISPW